jgi:hypothetical protein
MLNMYAILPSLVVVEPGASGVSHASGWPGGCDQRFRAATGGRILRPRIGMGSQP